MFYGDICGCIGLDGKFNPNLFTCGLLKELGKWVDDFNNMPADVLNSFVNELNAFANDIDNLIEFKNRYKDKKLFYFRLFKQT